MSNNDEVDGPPGTPGATPDARAAARGSVALFLLQTVGRGLSLVFVVAVAHAVSPSQFARYSIVTGLVLFTGLLADFGTTPVITRTVSRDVSEADAILSGTLLASMAFGFVVYGLTVGFTLVAGYPTQTVVDTAIGGLALPLTCVLTSVLGALDGAGSITARAIATFLQVAIIAAGGAAAVVVTKDIRSAILMLPIGSAAALIAGVAIARRRGIWTSGLGMDVTRCRTLLRMAVPFAVLGGVAAVYRRFDLVVLSLVSSRAATAKYDIALRVVEGVGYLGSIVSAPALFVLSHRLGSGDRAGAQRAFDTAARAVYLVGLPASAGLVALHHELPTALFGGRYAGAGVPLAILGGQLWVEFIGGLQGSLVVAGDHIRGAVRLALLVIGVLALLDVVLIIRYEAVGAAIAVAIFQVVNVIVFARFNRRTSGVTTPRPPVRVAVASLACGSAAWIGGRAGVIPGVAAGVIAYVFVLVVSGGLTQGDRDLLRRITRTGEASV